MARAARFIPPQLATLVESVPEGKGWSYEVKYDGYRMQAVLANGVARLFTRRGHDWTDRFPHVAERLHRFQVRSATFDGELVSLDASGRSVFGQLQDELDAGVDQDLTLFLFDLLELDGQDLRELPLRTRRSELERVLRASRATTRGVVRLGQRLPGSPGDLLQAACRLGLEGIIGKRLDAGYTSGRHGDWVKIKCGQRQEFVVIGFTPPGGSRIGIGSLLLAVHDKGALHYAGRVGSGFSDATLRSLHRRLDRLKRARSPLSREPSGLPSGVTWVKPNLVVEVSFTEWTADGALRHPVLQGIREDKSAQDVKREKPAMPRQLHSKTDEGAEVAGVTITHPDRVVFPGTAITKLDLAKYYARVSRLLLPHVADRPLALVRCPEGVGAGECFFQKHWTGKLPESLDTVSIRQSDGKKHPHVVIHDTEGLVTLVQWGVMEIHPWGARADDPDKPDRIIFDLDPGPGITWSDIVEAALGMRELLDALGLTSWVKTSGGKGLHVVVPIARRASWDEVSQFARQVAEHMQEAFPGHFVSKAAKAARKGVIFVDWLRNTRGATAVAPWSSRARPEAGVSVPLPWKALSSLHGGADFTVSTLGKGTLPRTDPWKEMLKARQSLSRQILQRLMPKGP
jgi:bifunctional non-homologous end joining protein LigD